MVQTMAASAAGSIHRSVSLGNEVGPATRLAPVQWLIKSSFSKISHIYAVTNP